MLELTAVPLYTLPESFRHRGKPSPWAEMTRPGKKMHSFLEGAFFDVDQNLWLSDVPYGRVFRISPEGHWEVMHKIDGEPHSMRITKDKTFPAKRVGKMTKSIVRAAKRFKSLKTIIGRF